MTQENITVKTKCILFLYNFGIHRDEAEKLVDEFRKETQLPTIKQYSFSSSVSDYPPAAINMLLRALKLYAFESLKKSNPGHFALFTMDANYTGS